jgi:hypothetical protein
MCYTYVTVFVRNAANLAHILPKASRTTFTYLLKSIFYTVNLKRFMATLPLILVISQGILLYYGVYRMYTDFTLRKKPDERQSELLSSLEVNFIKNALK